MPRFSTLRQQVGADVTKGTLSPDLDNGGATASTSEGKKPKIRPPKTFSAQVMSPDELAIISVPFSEVATKLLETLKEHGIAVVTDVVKERELLELEELFKQDLIDLIDEDALENAPQRVKDAYQRFRNEGCQAFPVKTATGHLTASAGFCLKRCLPHGGFAWKVRRHPNVHRVFRALFPDALKSEQLVTSLDATFFTPAGDPGVRENKMTAHVDQNIHDTRPGLADCDVWQGVLYIWPAETHGECSTTCVWPGSHQAVWPQMMDDPAFTRSGNNGFHYSEVSSMEDGKYAKALSQRWSANARRAVVPRGAMFLWNSRTMHCGWKGGPRLAQTVCLEPERRRPEAERISKMRLAALGLPGCHWARAAMQHDMSLGYPGVFDSECVEAKGGVGNLDDVILPLRPAIWPEALDDGADLDALAQLVKVDYRPTGMWDPIDGAEELLEESLKDAYKRYL